MPAGFKIHTVRQDDQRAQRLFVVLRGDGLPPFVIGAGEEVAELAFAISRLMRSGVVGDELAPDDPRLSGLFPRK